MKLTIRSIRSAGLVGMRAPPRPSPLATWLFSRCAKNSRTWQSVGWTLSKMRSKTTKPTGLVSIIVIALCLPAAVGPSASTASIAPAACRRKTSRSYADV